MSVIIVNKIRDKKHLDAAVNYIKDGKKTGLVEAEKEHASCDHLVDRKSWVSAYLCSAANFVQDIYTAAELLHAAFGVQGGVDQGPLCYSIVQSFPVWAQISAEEAHNCGLELVQRLGNYMALVCSHVWPVTDDNGTERGKQKHNHILVSAFAAPQCFRGGSKKFPNAYDAKYRLRAINDQIMIAHGLPIFVDPDNDRHRSWTEEYAIKQGASWKEDIRKDIQAARSLSSDWAGYVSIMTRRWGYTIDVSAKRELYVTSAGRKVKGSTLGRAYTRGELEQFWAMRDQVATVEKVEPVFSVRAYRAKQPLYVRVPLGVTHPDELPYGLLPLSGDTPGSERVWRTYFSRGKEYVIVDDKDEPVGDLVSGAELVRTLIDLRDKDWMEYCARTAMTDDELRAERKMQRQKQLREKLLARLRSHRDVPYFSGHAGMVCLLDSYDKDGRRKGTLELILCVIIVIVTGQLYVWDSGTIEGTTKEEVFFASTDWELQRVIDALRIVREEQIETLEQAERWYAAASEEAERARDEYYAILLDDSRCKEQEISSAEVRALKADHRCQTAKLLMDSVRDMPRPEYLYDVIRENSEKERQGPFDRLLADAAKRAGMQSQKSNTPKRSNGGRERN